MATITPEIRRAIEQAGDEPVRLDDPETRRAYVLIPVEQYERMEALLDEDRIPEQMYPLLAEVFGPEGWDDPAMDAYNDLDPRRR
jgi:hypothetical protein